MDSVGEVESTAAVVSSSVVEVSVEGVSQASIIIGVGGSSRGGSVALPVLVS